MTMRQLAASAAAGVIGLTVAASASANQLAGVLANSDSAYISGTAIKCVRGGSTPSLACFVTRNGKSQANTYVLALQDKVVAIGRVGPSDGAGAKGVWSSAAQPKAGGQPISGSGVGKLTVKTGQNFGVAGTHVICSVLTFNGRTGVACGLVDTHGSVPGSVGAVFTSHEVQVRTAEGGKSKVVFAKKF
jgi:hypothetical protein